MRAEDRRPEVLSRIRQWLGPRIDTLARLLGTKDYLVRPDGYVGTVETSLPDLESTLRDAGFRWDPISLYHRTSAGTGSDGSWVYRDALVADRQLHVVLFEGAPDRIDVYAHVEPNWVRHPVGHARLDDVHRKDGADRMRRWLDGQDMAYERKPTVVRKFEHVAERVREELAHRFAVGTS